LVEAKYQRLKIYRVGQAKDKKKYKRKDLTGKGKALPLILKSVKDIFHSLMKFYANKWKQ